jgi:hypothetical protein
MSNKHHELAPSSAPGLLQCASFESHSGRTAFSDPDADKGILIHEYTEGLLRGVDLLFDDDTNSSLDENDKEKCRIGAKKIKEYCESIFFGGEFYTEVKVKIANSEGTVISCGTQDIDYSGIVGGDIKSGFDYRPHNHDHRPQQAFYALGMMQKYGNDSIKWFEYFVMPETMVTYEFTRHECETMVEAVYRRKYSENKKQEPGTFCKYCAHLQNCPEVMRQLKVVQVSYTIVEDDILNPEAITDPGKMAAALAFSKSILKQTAKRLEALAENVAQAGLSMALTGASIPGYEIKERSRKTVSDVEAAFNYMQLPGKDFLKACSVSLPKLADAYYDHVKDKGLGKVTKKTARETVEGTLQLVITEEKTKYLDAI